VVDVEYQAMILKNVLGLATADAFTSLMRVWVMLLIEEVAAKKASSDLCHGN